jgi:hypothetical protein
MIKLNKTQAANKSKSTTCSSSSALQMQLFPLDEKRIEASFSGERISSDGGALLLREVENKTGILCDFAASITDNRKQSLVKHSHFEIICQRVFQIACGYEDSNDCDEMKSDSVMKICADRMPESGADLGSQATMCRFENSVNRGDLYRISEMFARQFVASYGDKVPKVIILDCDDTNTNCHGNQQYSLFNTYYKEHCLMPLHIYEGISGKLITAILKPGRRAKGICIFAILRRIIGYLRMYWKETQIIVRGDSHFCSPDLMDWAAGIEGVSFVTGLTGNRKLKRLTAATVEDAKAVFAKTGQKVKLYTEFTYQAGSWKHAQRVVAKVEYSEKGLNVRYVVSDFKECTCKYLYEKVYCARGKMELNIKDHKTYLKSDRSSCNRFEANQLRLFLHSAAYVLIHTLQKEVLKGTRFENATMKTIQLKVLKIAAKVKELKHKIKIVFPACTPEKVSIEKGFEIFRILGW